MNKHIIFSSAFVGLLTIVAGLFTSVAHAQTTGILQPDIKTYSTATSTATIITSPSGYKSEVISTYDGNQFHTFATSTPLTSQDIQNMQADFQKEQAQMEQMFQQQEELFKEQEQMFQNMWGNFGI